MRLAIFVLFLLSGACGLIYEVVWSRVMTQIFGSTVLAVGTVLAAFMSGMALGSYTLGRRGDRSSNPLRLYAQLELGIAAAALVSMLLMDRTASLYVVLHRMLGESGLLLATVRFAVAFLLVLVPTVLMGATLPVLSRFFITRLSVVGSGLSSLYAINTIGAVSGSLFAGFYLIARLGIHGSVYLAIFGNLAIGLAAWVLSRRPAGEAVSTAGTVPREAGESGSREAATPAAGGLLLWAFGLSGLASFAYEIFWTRALVHLLGNSTYAFTMMLAAFLSGIALGGFLIRFVVDRTGARMKWFAWLQLLIGATSAAALPLLFWIVNSETVKTFVRGMSDQMSTVMLSRFVIALLVMLVPATMIGATFPLVGKIYVRDLARTGADVGKVYAANTVGNVVGALIPGFLLLPLYGVQKGVVLMSALNVAIGSFILISRMKRLAPLRWVAPVAFVGVALALTQVSFDFQFPSERQNPEDRVLYYREGLAGTTKVFQERNTRDKRMSIDGIVIGGTEFTDYKQQLLAHFPKVLLADYDTELSVGLGSGILIGESLRHRRLERVDCLEIEPTVVEGASYFAEENLGVLDDPRARIVTDDVGNFLRTDTELYDIISADEKTADQYASNGFSYSADYYALLEARLTPRGLVIQWIPNHLPPSQYRMVLRTFAEGFPHVSVWYFPAVGKSGPMNTIVVGSLQKIEVDLEKMNATLRAEHPEFAGWHKYGILTAESLLAHYVADGSAVLEATQGAKINSLEHPYYEFYSPREYSVELNPRILRNHELLMSLRRDHGPDELVREWPADVEERARQAFEAEDHFLAGLGLQLAARPHQEIEQAFDAALEVAPWNENLRSEIVPYYWNEGGARYLDGVLADALYLMRRASVVTPQDGEVRYYHGLVLLHSGRRDEAHEELRAAIALEPTLLLPRRLLATELIAAGRFDEAAEHLEAILVVEPDDLFTLVSFADLLAEHGSSPEQAEVYLRRAHSIEPEAPAVIDALAWSSHLKGDRANALRIIREGGDYYEGDRFLEQRREIMLKDAP